jgi:hypothetical protein
MKKPNKKNYDFNDHFECLNFASKMIKYVDYLECKEKNPVYEWQYVHNSACYGDTKTVGYYTSKKEFVLTNQGSKPLWKVKESKRIRK